MVLAIGQVAGNGTGSGQPTAAFRVGGGDSVYVFIMYQSNAAGTITVTAVGDSASNTYHKAGSVLRTANSPYPAVDVWYTDNVAANSALTVNVTISGSTNFTICACDVWGADPTLSLDNHSTGSSGTSKAASDSVTSDYPNNLILTGLAVGQTSSSVNQNGSSPYPFVPIYLVDLPGLPPNTATSVWSLNTNRVGTDTAGFSWLGSSNSPWAEISVAIRSTTSPWTEVGPWAGQVGKSALTVSPIGISNGGSALPNNGADFGPDTLDTLTSGPTNSSGINEALTYSAGLIDALGKPAPLPVVLLGGVFQIGETIHLKELVPLMGYSAYFRSDPSSSTGARIIPTSNLSGFSTSGGGAHMMDTDYDSQSTSSLCPSRYLSGIILNASYDGTHMAALDGIHVDNPDHMTLDHVEAHGFIINFLIQARDFPAIPGEMELYSCISVADETSSAQTVNGFRFDGGDGNATTSPVGLTNIYLRDCHAISGNASQGVAYEFANASQVSGFNIWADGYIGCGIRCTAKSADSGSTYIPYSMRFFGIHLKSTALASGGPVSVPNGTRYTLPVKAGIVSLNLSGVTGASITLNGVAISNSQWQIGVFVRASDILIASWTTGTPALSYQGMDLIEDNDFVGYAHLGNINGVQFLGGEVSTGTPAWFTTDAVGAMRFMLYDVQGISGQGSSIAGSGASSFYPTPTPLATVGSGNFYGNAAPFKQQVSINAGGAATSSISQVQLKTGGKTQTLFGAFAGVSTLGWVVVLNPGDQIAVTFSGTVTWVWNAL